MIKPWDIGTILVSWWGFIEEEYYDDEDEEDDVDDVDDVDKPMIKPCLFLGGGSRRCLPGATLKPLPGCILQRYSMVTVPPSSYHSGTLSISFLSGVTGVWWKIKWSIIFLTVECEIIWRHAQFLGEIPDYIPWCSHCESLNTHLNGRYLPLCSMAKHQFLMVNIVKSANLMVQLSFCVAQFIFLVPSGKLT